MQGDTRDKGSSPRLGRFPGVRNSNPLQYSCLENAVDRGAWQATVNGVTKSWIQLSTQEELRGKTIVYNSGYPSLLQLESPGDLLKPLMDRPHSQLNNEESLGLKPGVSLCSVIASISPGDDNAQLWLKACDLCLTKIYWAWPIEG